MSNTMVLPVLFVRIVTISALVVFVSQSILFAKIFHRMESVLPVILAIK